MNHLETLNSPVYVIRPNFDDDLFAFRADSRSIAPIEMAIAARNPFFIPIVVERDSAVRTFHDLIPGVGRESKRNR